MAVYNGELFLREQLDSILPQLNTADEVVISDDGSTDQTLEIIKSYCDPRIRVLPTKIFGNPNGNFEYALSHCHHEIIFLADQDDIWHSHKIQIMTDELASSDLALCDCRLIDQAGKVKLPSFFEWNGSQHGMVKNIVKNSFVGCCMAFHRKLLKKILPFPATVSMHDQWIGLVALRYFNVSFLPIILVDHRKHGGNYSSTGSQSQNSWGKKVISRFRLVKALINP